MTAPLWTKKDVARYLAVSTRTVERIPRSALPVIVVGGRRRYREDDVLFYVASRSFGSSHRATQDKTSHVQ